MNRNIISIGVAVVLVAAAFFGVKGCTEYKKEVKDLEKQVKILTVKLDSLSLKASQDCLEQIRKIQDKNDNEKLPVKPVKPDFLNQ